MSDSFKWTLLDTHDLLQSKADLSRANDTLARIHDKVIAYLSPFFVATIVARQAYYGHHLHSTVIPPFVLKTNGVNVACSTPNTVLAYWRFFSVSCRLNVWSGSISL